MLIQFLLKIAIDLLLLLFQQAAAALRSSGAVQRFPPLSKLASCQGEAGRAKPCRQGGTRGEGTCKARWTASYFPGL